MTSSPLVLRLRTAAACASSTASTSAAMVATSRCAFDESRARARASMRSRAASGCASSVPVPRTTTCSDMAGEGSDAVASVGSPAAMERFGFVGLPNAGKSSLYNALAGGGALAAPYAFATTDPNVGVASVPDTRLERLAEMSASKKVVHAAVQFVDIGGLVEGASKGEGLGNRFLAHIREVDAIVYVLRAFEDGDVPGPTDPMEHLSVVELELCLADLETIEKQAERKRKQAKIDKSVAAEAAALDGRGRRPSAPARRSTARRCRRPTGSCCSEQFLLTNRPVLAVLNIDDSQLDAADAIAAPVKAELGELRRGAAGVRAARGRGGPDGRRGPGRDARGARPGRGGAAPVRAGRLPPARAADVPHHRRQGEPGVDVQGRVEGAPRAPASSTATSSGASSGPRRSAGTSCSTSARGRRPRTSARSASRARTTRSRTATSSRSCHNTCMVGSGCRSAPPAGGLRLRLRLRALRLRLAGRLARERPRLRGGRPLRRRLACCTSSAACPPACVGVPRVLVAVPSDVAGAVGSRCWRRLRWRRRVRDRRKGLLGRDGFEGALLIEGTRSVHTLGMRFAIDVAHLDGEGVVLKVTTMRPWRIGAPVAAARSVVEAEAGSFERWGGVAVGDKLERRGGTE